MLISEYFSTIRTELHRSSIIASLLIEEDIRTALDGYILVRVMFLDSSVLSYREYASIDKSAVNRFSYSYHYFKNDVLFFRYDNAPHFPNLHTFPHHKHNSDGTVATTAPPTISEILAEIKDIVSSRQESSM